MAAHTVMLSSVSDLSLRDRKSFTGKAQVTSCSVRAF